MHTNKEEQTSDGHLGWICWPQRFGRRMREPVFWKMLRCRHGMELHRWKNWMLSFVLADSPVSYHLSFWRIATSVESIERAKGAGCTVDVLSLGRFNLEVMNWPNVCDKISVQCCTNDEFDWTYVPERVAHDVAEITRQHTTELLQTHRCIEIHQQNVVELIVWKTARNIAHGTMLRQDRFQTTHWHWWCND